MVGALVLPAAAYAVPGDRAISNPAPGVFRLDDGNLEPGCFVPGRGPVDLDTHLDTPMLGSSPQAESGEIFFMVGGDKARVPLIQPMLDVMGRLTMHVGPSGTGNQIKLLHNALGAVNSVAVAESLALCDTVGVDRVEVEHGDRRGRAMAPEPGAAEVVDRRPREALPRRRHVNLRPRTGV